jgi:glutamine synthetase
VGIEAGDHSWVARYLLDRVCEDFSVLASIHPKPIVQGDWNGAGMHINFSTKEMREPGGMAAIIQAIDRLGAKHSEHIAIYGEDNQLRLTGKHETASINEFSYGVANRGCSGELPPPPYPLRIRYGHLEPESRSYFFYLKHSLTYNSN